jgi:hypothetical protein
MAITNVSTSSPFAQIISAISDSKICDGEWALLFAIYPQPGCAIDGTLSGFFIAVIMKETQMSVDSILALEELIDLASTAHWRSEKALEYPDDERNEIAAKILSELADEFAALEGSPVHRQLAKLMSEVPGEECSEIVSDNLREVGFTWQPESAIELLNSICRDLASALPTSDEDS